MKPKNIRKYPRVSATFSVDYTVGNKTSRGRALTLGGGGLFLDVRDVLASGAEISIRFRPAKHLPLIEAKASVCYQIPGQGAAIEFTAISPQHRQLLLRLIHHKTADRRRNPRAPLATQIRCQECMSLAYSRDVSLGGMFIETARPLPLGSRVNLRFNLDDDGPVVVAVAEVTYDVLKLGMGVQFIDIAPDDRKRIASYVSKSQGLPQPIPGASSAH